VGGGEVRVRTFCASLCSVHCGVFPDPLIMSSAVQARSV